MEEKRQKLMDKWGIDPVPDEELPPKETLGFPCLEIRYLNGATFSTPARNWL